MRKTFIFLAILLLSLNTVFSEEPINNDSIENVVQVSPFNDKLSEAEKAQLQAGEVLIKNIKYDENMSLNGDFNPLAQKLCDEFHDLNPKYLAEIIQTKPYEGNEDMPEKLITLLNNVPDYAGIPYYSERNDEWYDLYDSATIKSTTVKDNETEIFADLDMAPFGIVEEKMNIYTDQKTQTVLYTSVNLNKLRYFDNFDCVKAERMKMCILLMRSGDNWILYGIGGVNAPRIPFFTERIETSFMNRIKTFCNFIFTKF